MKVVLDRGQTYEGFLEANRWAEEFLPNWFKENTKGRTQNSKPLRHQEAEGGQYETESCQLTVNDRARGNFLIDYLEGVAGKVQLKYMAKKRTTETVTNTLLMFHPQDHRRRVLKEYQNRLRLLNLY